MMYKFITVIILSSCLVQGLTVTDPICWGCINKKCHNGEYTELEIKCQVGERFKITEVFYGQKTGSTTCRSKKMFRHPFKGEDCSISKDVATKLFQYACDDKVSTCMIRFKEDFYDQFDDWEDPCRNTLQFTSITYECQPPLTPKAAPTPASSHAQTIALTSDSVTVQKPSDETSDQGSSDESVTEIKALNDSNESSGVSTTETFFAVPLIRTCLKRLFQ